MSATPQESEWQRRTRRARERALHIETHGPACELCGAMPGKVGLCGARLIRALDEDHDHKTNHHRGWICARSNKQLWGWVTPAWLRASADYLEQRS
jgi:hypothetical protein